MKLNHSWSVALFTFFPGRQEQDPQGQEVARLTTELASQQQLLALLVDRVAPFPRGQAAAQLELPTQEPHEPVGRDAATIEALLGELRLLRAAASGQPAQPTPGEDPVEADAPGGAQLPLARLAPALSAFDPEGEVTQAGADSFWAWLDATPRAPWTTKALYGEWAGKVQYKCSTSELSTWLARAAPQRLEADAGRRAKGDLVDALARACADAARARAGSGSSRGAPAPGVSVLDSLRRGAGASQASI